MVNPISENFSICSREFSISIKRNFKKFFNVMQYSFINSLLLGSQFKQHSNPKLQKRNITSTKNKFYLSLTFLK